MSITLLTPIASLEVATPENKSSHSTLSSFVQESTHNVLKSATQTFLKKDAAHPLCDSPNTSRRVAIGAGNACLVPAW